VRTIPEANLDLVTSWVADRLEYSVKECIIYCGIQDLLEKNSKIETILDSLGALITELKNKNENVVVKVCELVPTPKSNELKFKIEQYNLKLTEWCATNGVPLISTELHFRLGTGEVDVNCFVADDNISDMKVFDSNGETTIQMPDYFHAININFSYQMSAIGASMPNLYIKEEMNNSGQFVIAGGIAGKKVSWNVYANRNDKYVQNHPEKAMDVINKKPHAIGKYYQPKEWGKPEEQGVNYIKISNHSKGDSK